MITILDRGIVIDTTQRATAERIAFFTSLFRAHDGTLFCGFQLGPAKNAATSTVQLCRSKNDGKTWQELPHRFSTTFDGVPGSLSSAELVEPASGRLLLMATWFNRSDPKRPLFDPVSEGILPGKQLRSVSTNSGRTWSPWEEVPIPDLRGCSITGPILKWSDGRIGYAFESYRECNDPNPRHHAAWLLISKDGGEHFDRLCRVAEDPRHHAYYWDQRLCVGNRPGEYAGLFWTHDLQQKKDLTVHFKRASIDQPADEPRQPAPTSIRGQIAAALELKDGRLFAFVVDRNRPAVMRLWVSPDGGTTWPEAESQVIYSHEEKAALTQKSENIDFKQYWEDMGKWSFGHPAIRELPDNRLLLAHYAGTPECMSIHWIRVRI
jgi:hypothetical protein